MTCSRNRPIRQPSWCPGTACGSLIAALQYLPARQRAVLILRDVLGWRAAEVAKLLGTTPVAVKSSLQRARARLEQVAPAQDEVAELPGADLRELLNRYVTAFESADITRLMRLLTDDAALEMPPFETWFRGVDVPAFLAVDVLAGPGAMRLVPLVANAQPSRCTHGTRTASTGPTRCTFSPSPHRASAGSSRSSTSTCSAGSDCRACIRASMQRCQLLTDISTVPSRDSFSP